MYGGASAAPELAAKAVAVELKATNQLFALIFEHKVPLTVALARMLGTSRFVILCK